MRLFEKGQGATEYLLMLAAVLVIVAIAIAYILSTGPSAVITGSAELKSGDNTTVIFTPSTSMTPATIKAADWEYEVYHDATLLGSGTGTGVGKDLERGKPVALSLTSAAQTGDTVKIKYAGTWHTAASVAK